MPHVFRVPAVRVAIPMIGALFAAVFAMQVLSMAEDRTPRKQAAAERGDGSGAMTWDSTELARIKQTWIERKARLSALPPMQAYGEEIGLLGDVLGESLSEKQLGEVASSCKTMPLKRGGFHNTLLEALVVACVYRGYRDNLVTLLSIRFPERIGVNEDVEYFIVVCGTKLKDPVLVLGEAYDKCQVPDVRRAIAAAVRRAFIGSGIRGTDDAEFVRNAMRWYAQNKHGLVLNRLYDDNKVMAGADYSKVPLFVERRNDKAPGGGR